MIFIRISVLWLIWIWKDLLRFYFNTLINIYHNLQKNKKSKYGRITVGGNLIPIFYTPWVTLEFI